MSPKPTSTLPVPKIDMIDISNFQRCVKCFVKGNKSEHFIISNVKMNMYYVILRNFLDSRAESIDESLNLSILFEFTEGTIFSKLWLQ